MSEAGVPPDDVAAVVAVLASARGGCGCRSDLLDLMHEGAPIYRGRGGSEVERLRGFIAVSLAKAGFADALMPYALEELETGTNAYAVAAAARVARTASALPAGIAELMAAAIRRIRPLDEFVDFDNYPLRPGAGSMTAVGEVIETLAATGPQGRAAMETIGVRSPDAARGDHACCGGKSTAASEPGPVSGSIAALRDVELQNQDGTRARLGDIFEGRPGLIAFFYTRCMNPDKCSRTISQLAEVERLIRHDGADSSAVIAGITYDPEYDTPQRLQRYGADRGLPFGERCQLLRSTGSFAAIRDQLQLGVGYGSATVNRHRIELLVVDASGTIVHANLRRLWNTQEMADLLLRLEPAPALPS